MAGGLNGAGAAAGAAQQLIARLLDQRCAWVPLPDTSIEVKVQRPAEAELADYLVPGADGKATLRVGLAQVQACVVDWRHATEAALLGPAIGGDDVVPFDAALWALVVADRHAWVQAVATAVLQQITAHYQALEDARGN